MADYASEQTLQELLAEAKAMNASLQKMASVLGRAPAGNGGATAGGGAAAGVASAAAGMTSLAKSISPASIALTALGGALSLVTKAFGVIGSIIGDLAGRLGNAVGAVVGFAKQMVDGTATLTSMVGMFGEMAKQIPLVGGALSGLINIIGMVVGRLEDSFKMYKDVAASGMTFGGSLIDMRLQVQNAGLTVDEFAGIARVNGELFATMGGNVQKGGELFLKSQQAITSGLKAEFAGLGMNAAEASSFLVTYMKAQGSMNKDGLRDSRANAQAALDLAQQTQFLTEATGKRREQIQQEFEEAAKEANFKAFLAGLSPEDAAKAMAKLNFALQKGGKDAGDMLKTGMMTGVYQPMTAAQARTDAVLNGALTDMVKSVGTATGTNEQIAAKMSNAGGKLANAVDVAYKDVGTVSALQVAQGKQGILSQEMLTLRNTQMENGRIKSVEKIAADEAAARAKITEDLKKGDAAGVGAAQMSLKEAGLKLNSVIDGVIGSFSGPLANALSKAADFIGKNADTIKEYGDKFSAWLKPWVDKFTSIKSWDEFKIVMLDFWNEIKQKVGPILKDLWDSVKPVLASAVSGLFEMMWDSVKSALIPRMLRSDTEAEKEADRKKLLEQQIEAVKKQEQRVADAKAALAKDPNNRRAQNALERQETTLANAKNRLTEMGGTVPAPAPDQATNVRNWAYSLMTGQAKESDVPATIKDSVMAATKDPALVKQADDYKAQVAQQAAQEKARKEAEAAAAKAAASQPVPAATPTPPPSAAPKPAQESSASAANVLNTQLATLVRASLETAEHTKKTASILASNGNALRR
jgi:hypothetical protein